MHTSAGRKLEMASSLQDRLARTITNLVGTQQSPTSCWAKSTPAARRVTVGSAKLATAPRFATSLATLVARASSTRKNCASDIDTTIASPTRGRFSVSLTTSQHSRKLVLTVCRCQPSAMVCRTLPSDGKLARCRNECDRRDYSRRQ